MYSSVYKGLQGNVNVSVVAKPQYQFLVNEYRDFGDDFWRIVSQRVVWANHRTEALKIYDEIYRFTPENRYEITEMG